MTGRRPGATGAAAVTGGDASAEALATPGIGGVPPRPGVAPAAVEAARFVSYAVLALGGVALFVVAGSLPSSQWEPLGAGAFPRLVLGLLIALAVAAMIGSGRALAGQGGFGRMASLAGDYLRARRLVLIVFAALAVYIAAMRPLGFGVTTFVFLMVAELAIAPRQRSAWAIALVIALLFSFGLQFLFAEVFNVFLPRGPWGF